MNIDLTAIKKSFATFLHRFHITLFVIIIAGGLTIVVFMLNAIIIRSGESGDYTPESTNTSFDQETIKRIEELKTRDQAENLNLPSGRINPFVE